jgi:hypothetical protein
MEGFFRTYSDTNLQAPMDAAVVIPTVLRPSLRQALESIFAQVFSGRIHVLIGIDQIAGDMTMIDQICTSRPSHCAAQVFWPGYSTAVRHGGLTPSGSGGALRAILSYLANSPYVAYLDDDNWWAPTHLSDLRRAIDKADWAFSLRRFVHPVSRRPICVDIWESVGPGQGLFNGNFGGFVDPSSLIINKLACAPAPQYWNFTLERDPMSADRQVFAYLSRHHKARGTGEATSFYTLNPNDMLHPFRVQFMGQLTTKPGKTL